jgi:hypothetical protein
MNIDMAAFIIGGTNRPVQALRGAARPFLLKIRAELAIGRSVALRQ